MKHRDEMKLTRTDAKLSEWRLAERSLLVARSLAVYAMMMVVASAIMQSIGDITLLEYYRHLYTLEKTGFLLATSVPVLFMAGFGYNKV